MASIIVRFIKTAGFVTEAIAFVTNSLFDHVEFGTAEGTWIGAHAGSGIEERPANYCSPTREYVYELPCTDDQYQQWLKWVRSKVGTPYDYADIAGLLIHDRSLHNSERAICSEFSFDGLDQPFLFRGKVLNVLPARSFLITPETLHLSPIFWGHLKRSIG